MAAGKAAAAAIIKLKQLTRHRLNVGGSCMTWHVQDAKARFSEMLEQAIRNGPQIVTRRGVETAGLVPIDEWRRLKSGARPTAKDLLLAPEPRFDNLVPRRRPSRRRRPPVKFE